MQSIKGVCLVMGRGQRVKLRSMVGAHSGNWLYMAYFVTKSPKNSPSGLGFLQFKQSNSQY
jgi:hypothetical protein